MGKYKGEQGFEIGITFQDGKLFAAVGRQQRLSLFAVNRTTFRPTAFDNFGTVTFNVPVVQIALILGGAYLATLVTTYLPARSASRVAPAEALRYE